jgi:hypothetical protein
VTVGGQDIRASDADRERAVDQLRVHAAAGRLTVEELDERSERAYAARTVGELARLLTDLPAPPPEPAVPVVVGRALPAPGGPGVQSFTYEWSHPVAPERAMREARNHIVPALVRRRYGLVESTPTRLGFACSYRPAWTWTAVVLLPPFGLLALMHRVEERIAIDIEPDGGGGTRIVASGSAPRGVRRAFAQLLSP